MHWVLREHIKTWCPDLSFAVRWRVLHCWHKQLAVRLCVISLRRSLSVQVFSFRHAANRLNSRSEVLQTWQHVRKWHDEEVITRSSAQNHVHLSVQKRHSLLACLSGNWIAIGWRLRLWTSALSLRSRIASAGTSNRLLDFAPRLPVPRSVPPHHRFMKIV